MSSRRVSPDLPRSRKKSPDGSPGGGGARNREQDGGGMAPSPDPGECRRSTNPPFTSRIFSARRETAFSRRPLPGAARARATRARKVSKPSGRGKKQNAERGEVANFRVRSDERKNPESAKLFEDLNLCMRFSEIDFDSKILKGLPILRGGPSSRSLRYMLQR